MRDFLSSLWLFFSDASTLLLFAVAVSMFALCLTIKGSFTFLKTRLKSSKSSNTFYNQYSTANSSTYNYTSWNVPKFNFNNFMLFRPSDAKASTSFNNVDMGTAKSGSSYSTSQVGSSEESNDPTYSNRSIPTLSFTSLHEHVRHEYLFQLLFRAGLFLFERVSYYIKNWVYSTNHKRIAINYFWFVIVSGVCGMILATIIRLEMAYPGIGVLAGDSLQYLSVVTAHAVIMVFFMIMPLLFGAFGNFLLPTQLGVHDVAFPRLNSAAFWFLPGGLLMLAQLVCLDRRYQRMNCFNIRELQSLLKNRYHAELLDDKLHTEFLAQTTLSTRFKLGGEDLATPRMSIFHNYPLFSSSESLYSSPMAGEVKAPTFQPLRFSGVWSKYLLSQLEAISLGWVAVDSVYQIDSTLRTVFIDLFTNPFNEISTPSRVPSVLIDLSDNRITTTSPSTSEFNDGGMTTSATSTSFTDFVLLLKSAFNVELLPNLLSLFSPISGVSGLVLNVVNTLSVESLLPSSYNHSVSVSEQPSSQLYTNSSTITNLNSSLNSILSFGHELPTDYRFQKTQIPYFKYDYRVGNYLPDDVRILNRSSFMTQNDITGGSPNPAWFFSPIVSKWMWLDTTIYVLYHSTRCEDITPRDNLYSITHNWNDKFDASHASWGVASFPSGFYNFFDAFSSNLHFINLRWVSMNALDQKFHNMFTSASLQQRIHNNWRQLKFTREGWRCKLLACRHQKTLYRRYINEDDVVWSVERNARDVLPGWAMITPFSARTRYTAIGKVDIGLMGVFLVLNSSIVSSANFLVTYRYLSTLNNRKMRDARSFFTEGVMVASWMMIAANPMLAIGILMLLSDRHWQTSFFDYSGGGDTVLFQHMFWFFGHPEVYVIMIPTFGFNNTILSYYLRKRVSARASLMYSMYTIAFLGFFVWGHHMYMVGLAHTTRMLFSTLTVMISVPAATKLMHWCVTIVNSSISLELPLVFQFLFIFLFVSGGVSGMCVAHTGMDILFHDSFYVVGHFHVMLAGAAMFASFGAFYFYFPAIFGVKFSRIFGYLHLIYYLLGQLMTVIPMFWLGYAGMPRRVLDYPASMGGWHAIVSAGHLLSVAGMMAFFIMIFDSLRIRRAVGASTHSIPRFNTRLNFYLYESARSFLFQRKGWYNARTQVRNELTVNGLSYHNFETLELTLFNYVFVKKNQPNTQTPSNKEMKDWAHSCSHHDWLSSSEGRNFTEAKGDKDKQANTTQN